MKAFFSWFTGLFSAGNRNTTLAGIVTLAGVAAQASSMASGTTLINPGTIGLGLSGLAAGVGLIAAKDSNSKVSSPVIADTVKTLSDLGTTAASIDTMYAPLKASIEAAGKQASDAAKIAAVAQAIQNITDTKQAP